MISIIIPLYNKELNIGNTLKSVLSQNYNDYEIVVVDDGSTDNSLNIVRNIKASEQRNGYKINIVTQENGGPSKARNTGIKNSKGGWIVFLDADDELLPGALKLFKSTIEEHPQYDFYDFSWCCDDGQRKRLIGKYKDGAINDPFKIYYYRDINPRMGSFLYSKDIALQCLFNEKIRRFEDDEMMFRVFNCAKIYHSSKPTMICNSKYAAASKGRKNIEEDFLGHIDFSGKSFWEKMCLYKFFLGEHPLYKEQCEVLYSHIYKRFDLLLLHKVLTTFKL